MIVKNGLKPKEPPVPAGTYRGRLVHVIDIGEQLCKGKKGDYYQNQVVFTFELLGKTKEIDGQMKPVDLSRTFGYTNGENSAFRKFVQDWTGVKFSNESWIAFEPGILLNKEAMVSVVHNETGEYANISNAVPMLEGDIFPEATIPLMHFNMDYWNDEVFEKLPEWAQERIKKSSQWQKEHAPTDKIGVQPVGGADVDAVPANGQMISAPTAVQGVPMQVRGPEIAPQGHFLAQSAQGATAAAQPRNDINVGAVQAVGGCPI